MSVKIDISTTNLPRKFLKFITDGDKYLEAMRRAEKTPRVLWVSAKDFDALLNHIKTKLSETLKKSKAPIEVFFKGVPIACQQ